MNIGLRCRERWNEPTSPTAIEGTIHRTIVVLVLALTLVSFASVSIAADFTGRVVGIIDGDTIEVLHNHHPIRIRLSGIDCPERGQA
jgi:micrococcal nuclease